MKVPLEQLDVAMKAFERDSQNGAFGARGTDRQNLDEAPEGWRASDQILRNELLFPFDTASSAEEFCQAFTEGDLEFNKGSEDSD
jgi:hypothetical protein